MTVAARPPKTDAVPPCARCGRPGRARAGEPRPGRTDGARFGVPGRICLSCGSVLARRARKAAAAPPPTLPAGSVPHPGYPGYFAAPVGEVWSHLPGGYPPRRLSPYVKSGIAYVSIRRGDGKSNVPLAGFLEGAAAGVTVPVRRPPRRRDAAVPACARCGTPEGRPSRRDGLPVRVDGRRFGHDGTLCGRCYDACRKAWDAGRPEPPPAPPSSPRPPRPPDPARIPIAAAVRASWNPPPEPATPPPATEAARACREILAIWRGRRGGDVLARMAAGVAKIDGGRT